MLTKTDPLVENWYSHLDNGQKFKVVAFDEDNSLVEIQHFDGDLEEVDLDTWYQLDIEPCEAPENWSGAIDVGEKDDLGTSVTDTPTKDWNAPLEEQPLATEKPGQTVSGEPQDDWDEGYPEEEPLEGE